MGKGKFLVDFFQQFSQQQLFFGFWLLVVGIFIAMFISYYRKSLKRNFRGDKDGPGPRITIDSKQLAESNIKKDIVVKEGIAVRSSHPVKSQKK